MRRLIPLLLAALLFAPLSTRTTLQAQGAPSAVRPLPRDTVLARLDSAAVARQRRASGWCGWESTLISGVGGAIFGGAAGVMLGAIPSLVLANTGHPTAARVTLWSTTGIGATVVGGVGALVGATFCHIDR